MNQFNFPTVIFSGQGALNSLADALKEKAHKKILIVTDANLVKVGVLQTVLDSLSASIAEFVIYDGTHPNPIEEDVEKGSAIFNQHHCDAIIAVGGGSPMDVAKVIKIMVCHEGPLAQYDDAKGGDKLITNEMPPLYAIPTTAGTGSEVGRCGVIILRENHRKTIFFSPQLMPFIAVLAPELTVGLPRQLSAATGLDAFTHCLEAWFAPGFHPMADGIAIEGIKLILKNLPIAVNDGQDLQARNHMLVAAMMGATAFQKGLGMIHSLAHPLSAKKGLHHGLANALLLPGCLEFMSTCNLAQDQKDKFERINDLMKESGIIFDSLAEACRAFFESLGIEFGLQNQGIKDEDLENLADEAWDDPCHATNMIPITREQLLKVYQDNL